MSTTIKFTATREATEPAVDWPALAFPLMETSNYDHVKANYIDTGLLVDHGSTISDTTISYWFVFKDTSALTAWLDDPITVFHATARNQMLQSENIPYTVDIS